MKIEIIKGAADNPVAEFFSSSSTPETDAFFDHAISTKNKYPAYFAPFEGFCQKLERARDEAITRRMETIMQCELYEQERDEAREALRQIWQSGDAFLPHVDKATTNRWRKAAGWEETK